MAGDMLSAPVDAWGGDLNANCSNALIQSTYLAFQILVVLLLHSLSQKTCPRKIAETTLQNVSFFFLLLSKGDKKNASVARLKLSSSATCLAIASN